MRTAAGRFGGLVTVLVVVFAPELFGSSLYQLAQLEYVLCMMMVCVGVNIATGYAGQLTLGPGATFGASAFAVAIFANKQPTHASLPILCLIGVFAGGLVGLIISAPALRLGGFYLAVVTLFMAVALPELAGGLAIAGKTHGISLLANPVFTENLGGVRLYRIIALLVVVVVLFSWALMHSRLGRVFQALRTSEELAQSIGISGYNTKIVAFVLSSLPAGLAGAVYVYSQQLVTPGSVGANLSIYLVAACVIGGFGTIWGPVVGAALVFGLQQHTGGLTEYQGLIFGGLLALFAILLPTGIIGLVGRWVLPLFPGRDLPLHVRWLRPSRPRPDDPGAVPVPVPAAAGALSVEEVTCTFGGISALEKVNLTVLRGQVHALIGSNGSGKTTMLNAICGYVPVHGGSVRIGDLRLDGRSPTRAARGGIARTFQTPKLVNSLSVVANVMVAAERLEKGSALESLLRLPRGRRSAARARAVALACLAGLGLDGQAQVLAAHVPHGSRRMVEVARCTAAATAFVLLDEPAAGLSATERETLAACIRAMAERGAGVLLIEHDTSFVFGLADIVTVLHRGAVIATGTPAEIQTHPEVVSAYLGEAVADTSILAVEGVS
ncbi:MAG: ABC transporter permease subunit [Frankia sp.]